MRYLVVIAEGGVIKGVEPFTHAEEAKRRANHIAKHLNSETDDVLVWDLDKGDHIYAPEKMM